MSAEDKGEITICVAIHESGNLIIAFGAPVGWIGLDAATARQFANDILSKCSKIDGL